MRRNVGLMLPLLAIMTSCKSQCLSTEETTNETRVEVITEYVTDTVPVILPSLTKVADCNEGRSHLETDYALSDAWINEDGSLHHELSHKHTPVNAPVMKPIVRRDSIVYRDRIRYVPNEVPVVKNELTGFQRWQIKAFWVMALFVVLCGIYKYRRFVGK